ncbi:uncharacterized protein [Blastocystis hominis]|uniref:Uncharacterized protein n=1 Tax=Blastocystis hominis TaxID=12968 RepID=D8M6D9_BLAHO|nr:uncharacterized protein [Blastocystis hominis]CBK23692.2 unnamed protein product [Blastocystis hominis]|eukprot:XP_012897740.1 uncharacterized protein [Blastocystis hominis]
MAEVTVNDESSLNTQLIQPQKKTFKQRYEEFKNSNIKSLLNSVRWSNFMASTVTFIFLIFNFINKIFSLDVSGAIISGFCVIFTGILSLYELHMKRLNRTIRRNFGFLFTYIGRAIFVFFIATILLSLWNLITIIMAIVFFVLAFNNIIVIVFHPAFSTKEIKLYDDPTMIYSSGDNEIKSYMVKNPELAQKVLLGAAKLSSQFTVCLK